MLNEFYIAVDFNNNLNNYINKQYFFDIVKKE